MPNGPLRSRRAAAATAILVGVSCVGSLASAGDPASDGAPTLKRSQLRELGRRLFFDAAATSRMGMRSCADCHDPGHGFSDREALSADDTAPTRRHAQTLVDGAANPSGHWDGEFAKIEDLVRARLSVRFDESGNSSYGRGTADEDDLSPAVISQLASAGGLRVVRARIDFSGPRAAPDAAEGAAIVDDAEEPVADRAASGAELVDVMPEVASADRVFGARPADPATALSTFVNGQKARAAPRLRSGPSSLAASQRYREAFTAAFGSDTVSAARIARAVAEYCHSIKSGTSAYDRHAAGDDEALTPAAKRGLELFRGRAGCTSCHTMEGSRAAFTDYGFHNTGVSWTAAAKTTPSDKPAPQRPRGPATDEGRSMRTGQPADARRFKTPTLRDVARHGPYMHDGSLATLKDVVRYYATGRAADPSLDGKFPTFAATDADIDDVVAFLTSLSSERRPGLASSRWSQRAEKTTLALVDADAKPLAGFRLALVPAGDVLPGFVRGEASERVLETDADGRVEFTPPHATHTRILLPDGLVPAGGDLVPDTCRDVRVVVPIRGRARLTVTFAKGTTAPETLVLRHADSMVFPDRRLPTTILHRRSAEPAADGTVTADYDGAYRTDVGASSDLVLPAPFLGMSTLRLFLDPASASSLRLVE